jgi:hypothetical protein
MKYGFRVSFVVEEEDPEVAQKMMEKLLRILPSKISAEIEEGPDELEENEEN